MTSEILMTMFSSFVALVSGVLFITEAINKLFKIDNGSIKLIMSWIMSFVSPPSAAAGAPTSSTTARRCGGNQGGNNGGGEDGMS